MEDKILEYIREWEDRCYAKGIPDEAPYDITDKVPSYKRIAIAILRNDISYIGLERKKSKYYSMFKRIEIDAREYKGKQLKLKL